MLELDNGNLFIQRGLCFRVEREYTNAWGWHCVSGTLFNIPTMTIQRNAVAHCNVPTTRRDIVAHAFRKALA